MSTYKSSFIMTTKSPLSTTSNKSLSLTTGSLPFIIITTGLLSLTILTGIALSSINVSADTEVIDSVQLTVPIACTMTGTGTTHTATLNPGTYSGASGNEYENGIGKTTMTAICNDDNGFSIYAIGYTGNEYGATNLIGQNTAGTISTKAYASGDTTSSWSMKLTKVTDTSVTYNPQNLSILSSYDSWHAVPATYTKVAQYKANTGSSTTDTTLGVKLETTYAAYISTSQAADIYEGQVKYTMVHPYTEEALQPQPATQGCINYFANASNAVGTMGCQSKDDSNRNISDGASVTLLASNFSRTGYGFAGWSDSFDYATNPNAKFYGPQETITVPTGTTANGLSLYAVWIKSQGSIQDQSKVASVCNSLTTAPTDGTANLSFVSALTDQRDNETYAIAKLADGNCWMIENLRLESTNSDNSTGALAQGYGTSSTYGNFSGLADVENTGFTGVYSANSLYSNDGSNDTINISTSDYPAYRMPRYNNTNTSTRASNPTANGNSMYSYGNYYTWHAAIADLTHNGTTNQSTTSTSLCPKGWHLPTGGLAYTSGNTGGVNVTGDPTTFREFYNLGYTIMGSNLTAYESNTNDGRSYYGTNTTNAAGDTATKAFRKYPNNFVYSGYFSGSSTNYQSGYYWSSTAGGSIYAHYLYLNYSSVAPGTNYLTNKFYGKSIRCLSSS